MKREKRLTKKERKAQNAGAGAQHHDHAQHIHCVACGRHIDPSEFTATPVTARFLRCQHGSQFASCSGCVARSQQLLDAHDRSGQPVQAAAAWH